MLAPAARRHRSRPSPRPLSRFRAPPPAPVPRLLPRRSGRAAHAAVTATTRCRRAALPLSPVLPLLLPPSPWLPCAALVRRCCPVLVPAGAAQARHRHRNRAGHGHPPRRGFRLRTESGDRASDGHARQPVSPPSRSPVTGAAPPRQLNGSPQAPPMRPVRCSSLVRAQKPRQQPASPAAPAAGFGRALPRPAPFQSPAPLTVAGPGRRRTGEPVAGADSGATALLRLRHWSIQLTHE